MIHALRRSQSSPDAPVRRVGIAASRRATPRIALVVDHPQRDLGGLTLVAMELARRGMTTHLVPLNRQEAELWALAPDLVLLNYARPGNDAMARRLLAAGVKVGMLDTEGAVWENFGAYTELLWRDRTLLGQLAPACIWGPRLAAHLVAQQLLSPSQIAVTGCPRFDFYHPAWRTTFAPTTPQAPRILINTNFSLGNPRFATEQRNRERLRDELGWAAERIDAHLRSERAAMAGIIELSRSLARDFPGIEIVLRPHPFEDPARYREALSTVPGITLSIDGPIQPLLLSSSAVIQRSCTTAIEAGFAGIPALSPQWIAAPITIPTAESVSIPCTSYPEMKGSLDAILGNQHASASVAAAAAAMADVVGAWFFRNDGLAHRRVGDAIEQSLPARREVDDARCRAEHAHRSGGVLHRGAAALRRTLGLPPDWSFRRMRRTHARPWEETGKYFDASSVADLAGRIDSARRTQGETPIAVRVRPARESGYREKWNGHSVTLEPAP